MSRASETARVNAIWDRVARVYDKRISFFERRLFQGGRAPDLRRGDAQALDFDEAAFDTVACTISPCSIPDHAAAIAEVRRVLRPGGRFVAMEHVRSPSLPVRAVQRAIDPLTVRFEGA